MKNFKEVFKGMFTGINKKLITYLLIAIGAVILIFIVLGIIKMFTGNRLSFENVESKMKNAAISYYEKNQELLPNNEGAKVVVDASTLVQSGDMKELSKITQKGVTCTGNVVVQKNGDYYLYTPVLDCGSNYKTKNLTEQIKLDNPVVTENDGLYQIGDNLVFRGEKVNNYIKFADKLWRIIRINSDGTLRIIENDMEYTAVWDDRYNIDRESSTGINDFLKSRLKDGLDKIYNELDLFNDKTKSQIVLKNLCIGKRYVDERNNSGDIECSSVVENKPIGLMQVNEFMVASLDPNCSLSTDTQCSNYNYLANYTKSTWTLTADKANSYRAYKFTGDGFTTSIASNESNLRLVIYLSDNLNYNGGTGTLEDPYMID